MLTYLLQVNLVWLVCWGVYRLCRGRDTFFQLRRALLLGIAVFALAFPFLDVPFRLSPSGTVAVGTIRTQVWLPAVTVADEAGQGSSLLPWALLIIYICVAAVLLLRVAVQLSVVVKTVRTAPASPPNPLSKRRGGSVKCRVLAAGTAPFSFFGWLCLPQDLLGSDALPHVVRHERVHIRQWHSADVVFLNLLCALCWFNPASWLTLAELRSLHEYIADGDASRSNARDYQQALLSLVPVREVTPVANSFIDVSPIKRRVIMMNSKRTHHAWLAKYLLLAPAALTLLAFNQEIEAKVEAPLNLPLRGDFLSGDASAEPVDSPVGVKLEGAIEGADSLIVPNPNMRLGRSDGEPLVIVDGKEIVFEQLEKLNPETIEAITVLKDESAKATYGERGAHGVILVKTKQAATARIDTLHHDNSLGNDITPPQFPGGKAAMQQFIAQHVQYPADALAEGVQGTVSVTIAVSPEGNVTTLETTGDEDVRLRAAAEAVVRKFPKMTPGLRNGKPEHVIMQIPVVFRLQ